MKAANTPAIRKVEDYKTPFNRIQALIESFQSIENATSAFQYIDQLSRYGMDRDATDPAKEKTFDASINRLESISYDGIIENEYPNLWKLNDDFSKAIKEFDSALEANYTTHPKDTKRIAAWLEDSLSKISSKLDHETVKNNIRSQFTDENRYNIVEHWGLKMRETKPNVWQEFRVELLNQNDFDEYMTWLYEYFEALVRCLERLETGYPKASTAKKEKPDTGVKPLKKGIIWHERWDDFHDLCLKLSQKRTFTGAKKIAPSGENDIQFIDYDAGAEDPFTWKDTAGVTAHRGHIPALAQFIKMLEEEKYFTFPSRMRLTTCKNFLNYFHLPTEEKNKPNYLSKQIDNPKPDDYVGIFKSGTWY